MNYPVLTLYLHVNETEQESVTETHLAIQREELIGKDVQSLFD